MVTHGKSPPPHLLVQFVLVVHMESLHSAVCCLKSGSQAPGKCCMFMCFFSVREDNFHVTFGSWVLGGHPALADGNAGW